jgi:hypothetical protein
MTLEQSLIRLMDNNKLLRANDRLLMIEQWRREGLELTPEQEQKFMQVSSSESIRRTRQKINERGLCLPDQNTREYRQRKAQEVKTEIRKEKTPILQQHLIDMEERASSFDPWRNS